MMKKLTTVETGVVNVDKQNKDILASVDQVLSRFPSILLRTFSFL